MSKKMLSIPLDLARLLAAEPDDYKDEKSYEDGQKVAKALLKLLLAANK